MIAIARWAAPALVVVACGRPPAQRPLPPGLVVDCFIADRPCRETADVDGDGQADTIVLVARTQGGETKRGLAVVWGAPGRDPLVIGAGARLPVVQLGDEETAEASLAAASPSQLDDDLSYLQSWGVVGRRPPFLPPGRGAMIKLSGGDAAWVVYLSPGDDVYYAPLGY